MNKKLKRIYDKLDKIAVPCPNGCHKCCGPVPMSKLEAKAIGLDRCYTKSKEDLHCEFVNKETGQCDIYENRPFVCRLFGTTQHGIFSCKEIRDIKFDAINEKAMIEIFDDFMNLIIETNSMKAFEEAMNKTYDDMKALERRNGWDDAI